jgi:predicted tellurium resistance membrane protein TerC
VVPVESRKKATKIGMFLAMFMRIALLFGINLLIQMKEPWFTIDLRWLSAGITGQSIILLLGGLFLIYKHQRNQRKVDIRVMKRIKSGNKIISKCTLQIIMIDLVFSFDSILTAVGMTNGVPGALYIMITAVVISVLIMMQFAVPVGSFVNKNPSIQILGLSF